mmetsp:Transcript_39026/g.37342  ORF Transcript_39026/g.37342 Transcript_39026/m.37342 type:complete len:93 (+) Transcript_39026:2299-2577(+)
MQLANLGKSTSSNNLLSLMSNRNGANGFLKLYDADGGNRKNSNVFLSQIPYNMEQKQHISPDKGEEQEEGVEKAGDENFSARISKLQKTDSL